MKLLIKLNSMYSKFLFLVIPVTTVLISLHELLFGNNDMLHVEAYIMCSLFSVMYLGFYIRSKKKNIVYFLVEVFMFYLATFLSFARKMQVSDMVWQIFILTILFCVPFILMLNMKYKKDEF